MFKNKKIILPIIIASLSLIFLLFFNYKTRSVTNKNYVEFLNALSSKKVVSVYLTDTPKIKIKLSDGNLYQMDNPRTDNFKETLLRQGVHVSENSPLNYLTLTFSASFILSVAFLVGILMKSSNITSKKAFSLDALDVSSTEETAFTFKNIAGNEEAKESVQDVIDFLKNPKKYESYGARMPKGIILYGEPGTGKTLLAKAIAGEAGVPFYALSGSDFVQVYVGVGASRIRQLFKKARNHKKVVIFIDEIDAIGKKRSNSKNGNSDERDQTLNALLTEMSGFNESEGIVVIAATNRLDMLDDALLRPGRFDRHIEVNLPDISAREKILSLYCENKPIKNFNIKDFAQKTAYFSGAKLENLVNEAAILACKEESEYIENIHFEKAFSIILAGYEKQNRDFIHNTDKKITAFHEAGHALVSMLMLPEEKVSKVTIIPSNKGAGGYTLSIPEDKLYKNKNYLNKKIMVLLAGRAAEELTFGADFITTGAHNDLKQCTNIAFHMITQYGMGNSLGLLNLEELMSLNIDKNNIILECKNLVDNLYIQTKQLLSDNTSILKSISEQLLEKETLYSDDLISLCN
ncbi:ATP-dependent metallopeptidase FtsH/Yme1/Tma family protein [Clostridium tetani]|uniref:ATP-dependent zinc metallopeptidase n=1 Tax=Clostridium tetani (strain Massachusetts / E88) TaxID=212717 RepID=Q898D1_CLOTE|nr:FtsH/Yme1/Tma family ATP-dependent metallopeptidase [Clostridium tetani]AAO35152.1 ATP-dependent zinc metallopeptidase [Clostridium tetani E88]KGI36390.1 cell division protein FtsH [Clostridium tetani]KGI37527.1 cell division protein FtsH [Clostridium tetani ATCC 9441]KGI46124.1 cell division protein FtsH [Clostridium tetani]KHO37975.1 cell division protein FtsH [Clostridium tetani]